jgi:hypothetical protein
MTLDEAIAILEGTEQSPQNFDDLVAKTISAIRRGEQSFIILWSSEAAAIIELLRTRRAADERRDDWQRRAVEVLRKYAIKKRGKFDDNGDYSERFMCRECQSVWPDGGQEFHHQGCALAALLKEVE